MVRPLCVVVVVLAAARLAGAQAMGPELRANAYTTGDQRQPAVAVDADGGFVIAWTSEQPSAGDFTPYYGPVVVTSDRLGHPTSSEFSVNTYLTGYHGDPAVAMWPSGEFVVTWMAGGDRDGNGYGVYGRRFARSAGGGVLPGPEFRVNAFTTNFQFDSDVAVLGNGDFVVTWTDYEQDGSGAGVFVRTFDPLGTPRTPGDLRVNDYTFGQQTRSKVAALPGGGFVVSWTSYGQDGSETGVFARRFAGDLTPSPEFRVNAFTTSQQDDSDVAADGGGDFVVVWNSEAGPGDYDIWARRYDPLGTPAGGEFRLNSYTTGNQWRPSVGGRDGAFVASWSGPALPGGGPPEDVFAVALGSGAGSVQPEWRVNTYTTGAQFRPTIAAADAERFVVAWKSDGQDGSAGGIYVQRHGDLIMQDGFEGGDATAWSFVADGGGDLMVGPGAAMKGTSFGLELAVDDTTSLYVEDRTPNGEDLYRARFYLDPATFDPGEAQAHRRTRVFLAFEEAPNRRVAAIVLRRLDGQYALMGRTRVDSNAQVETPFVPITAAAHFVEMHWKSATAPGANDGLFEMWIDDVPVTPLTGLDNDAAAVDFVRLGGLSLKDGASGTLRFDEFRSQRETRIGP